MLTVAVPFAEHEAAVVVNVATAGVANCAGIVTEAEAAEVQEPIFAINV